MTVFPITGHGYSHNVKRIITALLFSSLVIFPVAVQAQIPANESLYFTSGDDLFVTAPGSDTATSIFTSPNSIIFGNSPIASGVIYDGKNNLYFGFDTTYRYSLDTMTVTALPGLNFTSVADVSATGSQFDASGNLWYSGNGQLRFVSATSLASANPTATSIGISSGALAFNKNGDLYLGDTQGSIYAISAASLNDHTYTKTLIASNINNYWGMTSLTFDAAGDLLFNSMNTNGTIGEILKLTDAQLATIQSGGSASPSSLLSGLNIGPLGMIFDGEGNLFFQDGYYGQISMATPTELAAGTYSHVISGDMGVSQIAIVPNAVTAAVPEPASIVLTLAAGLPLLGYAVCRRVKR